MADVRVKHYSMLRQADGAWKASFRLTEDGKIGIINSDETFGDMNFGRGNINAPKRLKEILDLLDAKKLEWPQASFTDEGDFDVTFIKNMDKKQFGSNLTFKNAELTIPAYQTALKILNYVSKESLAAVSNANRELYNNRLSQYNLFWEHLPTERKWLVWGTARVVDGDTISLTIVDRGASLTGNPLFNVGKTIPIRLVGINTAETYQAQEGGSGEKRNEKIAKKYKIGDNQVRELGVAGKQATHDIVGMAGKTVIVDIDVQNGNPKVDGATKDKPADQHRYIGMVYKSLYDPISTDPMTPQDWYVNLNKTLISSASKIQWKDSEGRERTFPLAMVDAPYKFSLNDTRFDYALWEQTISIDATLNMSDIEKQEKLNDEAVTKQMENELEKLRLRNGQTTRELLTYIIKGGETLPGIVKYFKTLDMDVSEQTIVTLNGIQKDQNGNYILPKGQEIRVPVVKKIDDTNSALEFKHNSIIQDNTNDFFMAIDDRRDMDTSYHVRIGDVQLVVPPLSISVNQNSSIQKIKTLRTRSSMMTKMGSAQTSITMQLYFHDLNEINGHRVHLNDKLEDYYMDGLRPLIAQFKRAPFLPIRNEFINETLGIHEVCLVNLSVATVPGFPHSLAATLTLVEFDPEAYMPQIEFLDNVINYPLFRWYYQQPMRDSVASNPYRTYLAPIQGQLTNSFHFKIASEQDLIARVDAAKELRFFNSPVVFNEQVAQGQNLFGRMKRDADRAKLALVQFRRYEEFKSTSPNKYDQHSNTYKKIYGEKFSFKAAESAYISRELLISDKDKGWDYTPGSFFIKLEAETNVRNMPANSAVRSAAGMYEIADITQLETIIRGGEDADKGIRAYRYNFNKLRDKAESTEGQVQMDDYFIDDIYIVAMNITYENNFSQAQTQTGAQPTYQFLGSQDPYVQITLETNNRESIADLQNLIKQTDEFTRKYRYGITSGFLGFENQLAGLFGVRTVLVEQCAIHTVPGFPDRFQVNMVLCAFDKTQKRSETLEGFSAASSTNMYDRYVSRDPSQADAIIIEKKMKDLELYPDLELPTYQELNTILPYIDAGFHIYHNGSAAKFVDPDFYISTGWTYRTYFKQFLDKDNKNEDLGLMELRDFSGVVGTTRVNSDNYFEPDGASAEILKSVNEKTKAMTVVTKSNPMVASEPTLQGIVNNPLMKNYTGPTDKEGVKAWASDINNVLKRPLASDILRWRNINTDNNAQDAYNMASSLLKDPTGLEMYKEIYRWVDELWTKNEYVFDDNHGANETVKAITYGNVEDVAAAYYNYLQGMGDGRFKTAPKKADGKSLGAAVFNKTKGLITRERWANYIKALYHQESAGWHQFNPQNPNMPYLDGSRTAAGLGQFTFHLHAHSVDEAQRMIWDWKYNVEVSMRYLFSMWVKAWNSEDPEVRSRPWDWAIRWYNLPAAKSLTERTYWSHEVMGKFNQWYNAESMKYNTGNHPQNTEVRDYLAKVTGLQGAPLVSNREDLIRVILDKNQLIVQELKMRQKPYTKAELEAMPTAELTAIYESINRQFQTQHGTVESYGQNQEATQYQEMKKALKSNNLINNENPNALWRDQFTDLVEYDHRGRLLRAFPTFQMFLIDEGRWMANYKIWDNLYGFNAIQSIDVHKSRKIAADTAVITMTNVYSNLTARRIDEDYGDWTYSIWDNLLWGKPTQQLLEARKDLASAMMLQTGARIHLRMGYGSDATSLPVMFNGTITEMDTSDLVTIVAQSDGIELTNPISADPNETNDGFWSKIIEPRDLLCKLLTSKGNWFKDVINNKTNGAWFADHPFGIAHFGNPVKTPDVNANYGAIFGWYEDGADMGEAVQNIYSSNGENTFSQYRYQDGTQILADSNFSWTGMTNLYWAKNNGDEADVKMKLYGQTVWDVAQTLAYVSPDYIAAVHPFEMRSTLFFGKPYYKIAHRYDSVYGWDPESKTWNRTVTAEYRKPFQQFHVFMSNTDIISNRIKASEEGVYTNVIAMVDGHQTAMQSADEDIRFDKQKTKIVETNLIGDWAHLDLWGIDKQGECYAQSALRDYIKDMYKGSLVVMGDPTIKPHDMCYLSDVLHDMNGTFLVKDVTHSFSIETGFISTISPDAVVVADDMGTISQATWLQSAAIGAVGYMLGKTIAARALRKLVTSSSMLNSGAQWSGNAAGKAMLRLATMFPHEAGDVDYAEFKKALQEYTSAGSDGERQYQLKKLEERVKVISGKLKTVNPDTTVKKLGHFGRKGLVSLSEGIVKNLSTGRNALAFLRLTGVAAGIASFGITVLATAALTILTESISEKYRRMLQARQAVIILPLKYQGRDFTAGLNGVAGAVIGTKPGKMDQFWMGTGYGGKDDWTKTLGTALRYTLEGEGLIDNLLTKGLDPKADLFSGSKDYDINTSELRKKMND